MSARTAKTAAKKTAAKTASQKLAGAKRPQDTYTVYIPGPLLAEWNRLKVEFDQTVAREDQMLAKPGTKRLAKQMADLETRMREDAINLTLQALRRQRTPSTPEGEATWKELLEQHPPRKGDDGKPLPEDSLGFTWETFPEALVRASIVNPQLSDEELDTLLYDVLTDGQYDRLFKKCWALNRGDVDVPFSSLVSKTLSAAPRSKQPSDSASPASGSSAGSPDR